MKLILLAVSGLLICGCNTTKQIGKIGDVEFYKIHSNNLGGPSLTALVTKSNGVVRIESVVSEGLTSQPWIGDGLGVRASVFQGYGKTSSQGGVSSGIRPPPSCPSCIAPL